MPALGSLQTPASHSGNSWRGWESPVRVYTPQTSQWHLDNFRHSHLSRCRVRNRSGWIKKVMDFICLSIRARPLIMDSNAVLRNPLPGRIPCPVLVSSIHPGFLYKFTRGSSCCFSSVPLWPPQSKQWMAESFFLMSLSTKISCCPSYRQFLKYSQRFSWLVKWQPSPYSYALQSETTV